MSFIQTPQRPLPGAYQQTPAFSRTQPGFSGPSALFRSPSGGLGTTSSNAPSSSAVGQLPPSTSSVNAPAALVVQSLKPLERAAKTINETLAQETRYPELDAYVGQGISSDYDIPSSPAWAPFQKTTVYNIPDRIFEQYNQAQVATLMGLFAELNHAWISIDNALYLWDYTRPNPDLVGFEEQPNSITAVKLTKPRLGVFVPSITHLLIVATTAEVILIALSAQPSPTGGKAVSLFQTKMTVNVRALDVTVIEGSADTGRVFFGSSGDNDVYELTYQQEEKWFQNRCGKINHTTNGIASLTPSFVMAKSTEHVVQMVVDDSRSLLYTLSSRSTIRTFHMKPNNVLELAISKDLSNTFSNIGHMLSRSTELLGPGISIVSISPVSAREATKIHLMATTSTGCRLFLSATSSSGGWGISDSTGAPTSMQVQHVKFPPPELIQSSQQKALTMVNYQSGITVNTQSKALSPTRTAQRFAPGHFFCFKRKNPQDYQDTLFLSAPDSGRIARPPDGTQPTRYHEYGIWLELDSCAEDIGLVSAPFGAASKPAGFGNELAVQYDKPSIEVAILTNSGIQIIRRRRLVDIFAAIIQYGPASDGLETEINKFIRQYGRGETAATALAVACGQGLDVASDSRTAKITDPDITGTARKAFIEHGGKPILNENIVSDQIYSVLDSVRPSPRHEGIALYMSRIVRSIWKAPVVVEGSTPTGGLSVVCAVPLPKLREVQADLMKLQEFLDTNKSFIDGLAGPESIQRVNNKQEEIALQAEHRALYSLVLLISDIIEGISFTLMLFDERVDEIILALSDSSRQHLRQLNFEGLFATDAGKELAKDLVKAIVNRNINNGSNVDTVAEALRRRCGSFCSADDVIIFKAQEQLKRAGETGGTSDLGRNLLRESLKLFEQVAGSLPMDILQWVIDQYISMSFFAGAIQLCLNVAQKTDPANVALSWIAEGRPDDSRKSSFESRKQYYNLIHKVITAVDEESKKSPYQIDGQVTVSGQIRNEAYAVVNGSTDEVFQTDLYDWYRQKGLIDRLLEVQSDYIVSYLRRISEEGMQQADLLWRYYAQAGRFHNAAEVQLQLAKSEFKLTLDRRIEYLSKARANASAQTPGVGRQPRQLLMHEVAELLDVANIQDDLLQRLRDDPRLSPERKPEIVQQLNGKIIGLTDLYNNYADQASYFDICLLIYQAADHRNPADVRATWQGFLKETHEAAIAAEAAYPWEKVIQEVRRMGKRLRLSDTTFPIPILVPMLEKYAFEYQRDIGPQSWVVELFLDLGVSYASLVQVLESMFYADEAPFAGRNRAVLAKDLLHVIKKWFVFCRDSGKPLLGGDGQASAVLSILGMLQQNGLEGTEKEDCVKLRLEIDREMR